MELTLFDRYRELIELRIAVKQAELDIIESFGGKHGTSYRSGGRLEAPPQASRDTAREERSTPAIHQDAALHLLLGRRRRNPGR